MKFSLINPFGSYFIAATSISALYFLGFSDLYPKLSVEMVAFLLLTSGSSLLLAIAYASITQNVNSCDAVKESSNDKIIFLLISVGFFIEFIYSKSIPLISLALGAVFDYREFGIPTFHVLLVGVNFFYAIRWCSIYFKTKNRSYLLMQYGSLGFGLLIMNRGAIIISLIAALFIYANNKLNLKQIIKITAFTVIVIWLFGYIGNLRFLTQEIFVDDPILRIGSASSSFKSSGLPNEFFWVYLYATSPLANFQLTINSLHPSWHYFFEGLAINFIPDFLSKHLIDVSNEYLFRPALVTPELTVSTAFAPAFATMGWLGPYALYAYYVAYTLALAAISIRSQYHQPIMALASAQAALLFFDNMLVFSGAIGPVLIGLLLVVKKFLPITAALGSKHYELTTSSKDA